MVSRAEGVAAANRNGAVGRRRSAFVRVGSVILTLALLLVGAMAVFEAVGPQSILEPSTWQTEATVAVAVLSIALLAVDVVLPVPSSVVLVANGAVFGVALGSVLSFAGLVVAALVGYALGRRGSGLADRALGDEGFAWLRIRTQRHGVWLVGATRVVPLASEITALVSGATRMPVIRYVGAAAVGAFAASIPLALIGAGAVDVGSGPVVLTAALLAGGGLWLAGRAMVAGPDPDQGSGTEHGRVSEGAAHGV